MAVPSARCCLWRRPPLMSPPRPLVMPPHPSRRHRLCACNAQSSLSPVQQTISRIEDSGIIACLRANSPELAFEAACAALGAGITVLEIVRSTPGVFEVLRQLVQEHPRATLGVGTILNAEDAQNAIVAGAKFLMSPAMVKDVLSDSEDCGILYIPGVMTPTEMLSAYDAGAKIVKVYPVSALGGTHYISALKKPFPHIPMVASQGIAIGDIQFNVGQFSAYSLAGEYIAKGASAVVVSDAIFTKGAMAQYNLSEISKFAHIAALQCSEAVNRRKRCLK